MQKGRNFGSNEGCLQYNRKKIELNLNKRQSGYWKENGNLGFAEPCILIAYFTDILATKGNRLGDLLMR